MSSVAEKLQRKAPRKVNTKQVRLKLVYLDFWSVVKLAFLGFICLGIIQVVFAVLVWVVLNTTLVQVSLFAVIVAVLNIVVGTALGAIFAGLYNLSARVTGGLLVGFQNQ